MTKTAVVCMLPVTPKPYLERLGEIFFAHFGTEPPPESWQSLRDADVWAHMTASYNSELDSSLRAQALGVLLAPDLSLFGGPDVYRHHLRQRVHLAALTHDWDLFIADLLMLNQEHSAQHARGDHRVAGAYNSYIIAMLGRQSLDRSRVESLFLCYQFDIPASTTTNDAFLEFLLSPEVPEHWKEQADLIFQNTADQARTAGMEGADLRYTRYIRCVESSLESPVFPYPLALLAKQLHFIMAQSLPFCGAMRYAPSISRVIEVFASQEGGALLFPMQAFIKYIMIRCHGGRPIYVSDESELAVAQAMLGVLNEAEATLQERLSERINDYQQRSQMMSS